MMTCNPICVFLKLSSGFILTNVETLSTIVALLKTQSSGFMLSCSPGLWSVVHNIQCFHAYECWGTICGGALLKISSDLFLTDVRMLSAAVVSCQKHPVVSGLLLLKRILQQWFCAYKCCLVEHIPWSLAITVETLPPAVVSCMQYSVASWCGGAEKQPPPSATPRPTQDQRVMAVRWVSRVHVWCEAECMWV